MAEQEHEFSMTVLNDANGTIYAKLRELMLVDFNNRMLDNGFQVMIKSRGDQTNAAGVNLLVKGVRILNIGGL